MKESDKIELRSEEVQDILTRPPHALIRYGISVICGVIILLIVSSFFFKYPDIITGTTSITTQNPPIWMVAKTNGKIKELYCTDKDSIPAGKLVAVVENPTSTEDIYILKRELHKCIITDSIINIPADLLIRSYELGDIQTNYSAFIKNVMDYENFLTLNQIDQEKKALYAQISGKNRYTASIQQQMKIKQKELEIAESTYEREKKLYEKGVLSQADIEVAERNLLNIKETIQQLQSSMISDQIDIAQLNQNITKYDVQYLSEKNRLFALLKSSYHELNSFIENWEQTYLFISPEKGTLTFNTVWSKNQFVKAGENVFAVVPHNPGEIIGRIAVPASGAGKIKIGQTVNIKVSNYPYMEYGLLPGKVQNISLVSNENNYIIEIALTQGLITTTGKQVEFKGELLGEAEIITDDLSLAERIISPLKTLLQKYKKSN